MAEFETYAPPIDTAGLMTRAEAESSIAAINSILPQQLPNVTITETATVALAAGVRKVTVTAPGVMPGGNYVLFPVNPTPAGYALADVIATMADKLQVTISAPLLALASTYSILCRLVQIRALPVSAPA